VIVGYFLKQLKCAGVPRAQMLHFYISVIRPVLEYAVPVWHHILTRTTIESVQKRALRIIYSFSNDIPYSNSLDIADIASLSTRRNELFRIFSFCSSLYLFSPLPTPSPRDPDLLARLRASNKFPAYPHELKKSVFCIIRPFPLSNMDYIFTSDRLYTPSK